LQDLVQVLADDLLHEEACGAQTNAVDHVFTGLEGERADEVLLLEGRFGGTDDLGFEVFDEAWAWRIDQFGNA
jgi:hypothetical protein